MQFHPRKEILADHENEETEPEIRTDADTVKESEIKWTKIKLMTKTLRPFTLKQHRLQSNESTLKLNYENMEVEPEVLKPDAAIVKEMVEMKFLTKKRKVRLRTPTQRLFARKQRRNEYC